jgi:hypothetical protein
MTNTEAQYINAGFKYEAGKIQAATLRAMIEQEHPHDKAEARRLIEQGRTERRKQQ